jgi:hypothetical protein
MKLVEVDTRKNTAFKNVNEYQLNKATPNYAKDAAGVSKYAVDNWAFSRRSQLHKSNYTIHNQRNFWAENVKPVSRGTVVGRDYSPLPLHPVIKPENELPWAKGLHPHQFAKPSDYYPPALFGYIQY